MEVDQDHVQTLLSMGFPNESDVRKALRLAKNSLNDAVAILTNDHPTTNFDTLDEIDVEMKDLAKGSSDPVYGPNLPPTYDEAVSSDVSWTNNTRKILGSFWLTGRILLVFRGCYHIGIQSDPNCMAYN